METDCGGTYFCHPEEPLDTTFGATTSVIPRSHWVRPYVGPLLSSRGAMGDEGSPPLS